MEVESIILDSNTARKEKLCKAFSELEERRVVLEKCTLGWMQLEQHLLNVHKLVEKRREELVEKEKEFEIKMKEMQESLEKRGETIESREEASLARIQEQKESAIAAIMEERTKWEEGKPAEAKDPNVWDAKSESEIADIANSEGIANNEHKLVEEDQKGTTIEENVSSGKTPESTYTKPTMKVRPQLKAACENMNGDALRKYAVDRRKDMGALRDELISALQSVINPACLVLSSLEGYHAPDKNNNSKKDAGAANRRACILILECAAVVLADPVLGEDHPVVPSNIKGKAKELADMWKSKIDIPGDVAANSPLDAQAFLQLLATFGIYSEYSQDELCKLVTAVAKRRQSPSLCKALGLSTRIPDIVDMLSKEGKQMEALSFAQSFGIMNQVQPVTLLKAFLKDARNSCEVILKSGIHPAAAQNDASMKEISALKAVVKCIEEYKLESQYPAAPLKTRIEQLEKEKADKKMNAAQVKRPRTSPDRSFYRSSERAGYGYGGQAKYDRRGQESYNSYRARSPIASSYLYPDGLGASLYGSYSAANAAYGAAYGGYQFGSGLPPPPPAYQASFLQ